MNRPDISETGAKAADERQRAGLGQAMILGTNLAVGMVLFAFLGYVVDRRRGGGIFWTVCGMFIGLVYGTYEVWKVVRLLDKEIRQRPRAPSLENKERQDVQSPPPPHPEA